MGTVLSIQNDLFLLSFTTGEIDSLEILLYNEKDIFVDPIWSCPNCQLEFKGVINKLDGTCGGCGDVILHDVVSNKLLGYVNET